MVSSTQVMNAQDANAPLRDVGKKDEEREEESEKKGNEGHGRRPERCEKRETVAELELTQSLGTKRIQSSIRRSSASRKAWCCKSPECSTTATWTRGNVNK